MIAKCGLERQLKYDKDQGFTYDLSNQVALHVGTDSGGILGDYHGDATTINTDCADATLVTKISFLKLPDQLQTRSNSSTYSNKVVQQAEPTSPSTSSS